MNEIYSYDPETYHATLTHSVYVRLEGSVLRLSKPNRNVPRRATFNELKPDVSYVSQKIYDLTNSKVGDRHGLSVHNLFCYFQFLQLIYPRALNVLYLSIQTFCRELRFS